MKYRFQPLSDIKDFTFFQHKFRSSCKRMKPNDYKPMSHYTFKFNGCGFMGNTDQYIVLLI